MTGVDRMAGTAVVAMGASSGGAVDVAGVVGSVRALMDAGWNVVVVAPGAAPGADPAGLLTLAIGQTRSGRRAVPVLTHTLVDPADPALAQPSPEAQAEPLAVLEAEAIAALVDTGFPVVVSGRIPVAPFQENYRAVAVAVDAAASAQRLAGDLGAPALVFVATEARPLLLSEFAGGEIDVIEAERRLTVGSALGSELRAAVRFVRAGGDQAVITTPGFPGAVLDGAAGPGVLRVRRTVARPRSETPALAAGWC